jgi:cellulose synthase (UDP-forming)
MAGATTDIQYIVHQGFTHSNATYWVGANALIRKTALCDIATSQQERGHSVPVFIQDRTVIEDTESTVDLIARGWRLHNYPERLAYSATPPDFGALLIQRRRWANGGLLILPKLLRYFRNRSGKDNTLGEALQRVHYLVSITAVNFGLVVIMAFPLTEGMPSLWLPLTVASYFVLLGRDLSQCGYRVADLVRFYALTIVLIPVNIGGVCKSLQQGLTGKRIPFARTPKVTGRTATPAIYILAIFALMAHWAIQFTADVDSARWFHAIFVASNTLMLLYGLVIFIGLRTSIADIARGVQLQISLLFFRKPNDQLLPEVAGRSE